MVDNSNLFSHNSDSVNRDNVVINILYINFLVIITNRCKLHIYGQKRTIDLTIVLY
jgi:hypothetical protein